MAKKHIEPEILEGDAFDSISAITGKIAHDMNNLMTPLLAYPQLIRNEMPEGSMGRELVDVLEKTAKDIVHMVGQIQLLALAKTAETEDVNVNVAVEEAVKQAQKRSPDRKAVFKLELASDTARISASFDHVRQAAECLCDNAVESLPPEGGNVTVRTENIRFEKPAELRGATLQPGRYVRVTVSDTGCGIPEDDLGKIFDLFFTTKKDSDKRGSGLGLSIVYRVLKNSGGAADVRTSEGGGTTVALYFPAAGEAGDTTETGKDASKSSPSSEKTLCDRKRLMIVDDEATIRRLFQMILSAEIPGVEIDAVRNGKEAVDSFSAHHHKVILMDLHMPVMDGQAAFLEIERVCALRNWEMPSVIFCTGFAPPDMVRKVVAGSTARHHLLSKPVSGETIVQVVKERL